MLVNINVENKCCTTDFDHLISDTHLAQFDFKTKSTQ